MGFFLFVQNILRVILCRAPVHANKKIIIRFSVHSFLFFIKKSLLRRRLICFLFRRVNTDVHTYNVINVSFFVHTENLTVLTRAILFRHIAFARLTLFVQNISVPFQYYRGPHEKTCNINKIVCVHTKR